MSWLQLTYKDEDGEDATRLVETPGESRVQVAGASGFESVALHPDAVTKVEIFAENPESPAEKEEKKK